MDGVPLDLASSLLPKRTRLRPGMQAHIHLHSRFQKRFADAPKAQKVRKGTFGMKAHYGLIDSLGSLIRSLKWKPQGTEWADYEDDNSYVQQSTDHKEQLVTAFLKEVNPATVWDLGSNTGRFSRLASNMGIETVSFDFDPSAVEKNYLTLVDEKESSLLPLLVDLFNPSSSIGWANQERMSLVERGPADMVFALALIHHLAISGNVPLGMIAEYFSRLCRWAIVEFVPKADSQVARLLATREDIFPEYKESGFEDEFGRFFDILAVEKIDKSERTLYMLRSKEIAA